MCWAGYAAPRVSSHSKKRVNLYRSTYRPRFCQSHDISRQVHYGSWRGSRFMVPASSERKPPHAWYHVSVDESRGAELVGSDALEQTSSLGLGFTILCCSVHNVEESRAEPKYVVLTL